MDASLPATLSLVLLLLALPPSRPWPSSQRQRGVTAWPSPQQGGVVANVQVHHLGHSGMRSHPTDLAPAAQTYYEHLDARTPHQPVTAYRLQQHHPPAVQYAATQATEAITTTYAPPHLTEQPPRYALADSTTQATYQHAHYQQPKSLLKSSESPDIQHELQLTLSQQIQVQLEQLQKLHELQNKMLRGKTTEQPSQVVQQVVQQGSENVNHQVLQPERQPIVYAPQTPSPFPQHATTGSPVVYASQQPSVTPAPPPLLEPRYPEESQSLTSFIGEPSTPAPVGGAISNGFQPMLPPRPPHQHQQHRPAAGEATDFQPFTEHATDPALPYYLLPPAANSDSEFNRLPAAHAGELEDIESPSGPSAPASSVEHEHEDVEHPIGHVGHSVRGKHRLRPPRGKGGKGGRGAHAMTQPLRKHCGSIAASLGAPCRLAAFGAAAARPTTTRRPTATPALAGETATAAGSAVRLRIASPRIRFRDGVDPRAPLTLMARHPGAPGRPPVTVMHAVHKIRIINRV